MGKILVIAEKPSAGMAMAKVLGCMARKEGYIEGDGYIVTWAVGHLIGLKYPEEHDARYKSWKLEDLPYSFDIGDSLKVLPAGARQYETVRKLINRPDVDSLINGGDAGREGYLIQSWIYRLAGNHKPVKVLWASSLTDEALKKAFDNLKEDGDFKSLLLEAEARAEGDHKLGINYSRALTLLLSEGDASLSYGRCQTPLLNLIVSRDKEVEQFKATPFFNLESTYRKGFKGILVDGDGKRKDLPLRQEAEEVLNACQGKTGVVENYTAVEKSQPAPLLFDLATLQKKMGSAYGFTMDYTLEIAQSLYEKHKILSYPRTDSRYLSNDLYGQIGQHLSCCRFGPFRDMIDKAQKDLPDKLYFNDKKVTDHHALLPTINAETEAVYSLLTEDERKVFSSVVLSLAAIFYPNYQYSAAKLWVDVAGNKFLSEGTTIRCLGYKTIYTEEEEKQDMQILPELTAGAKITLDSLAILEKTTKAPKRYSVSSIVSLMEKYSIGTPATRAEIVKKLQNPKRKFLELEKGGYFSTELGREYIAMLPEKIKAPELTMLFEEQLRRINAGEANKGEFLKELDEEIANTIEELKQSSVPKVKNQKKEKVNCPICGKGHVIVTEKSCFCSDYKNGCGLSVWRSVLGKKLTDKQIMQLLANGRTAKIKGFQGKKGDFDASLELDPESGKIKFVF